MHEARTDASGQATVELALLLPVIFMLLLAVLQVGLVARDQVLVANAAAGGGSGGRGRQPARCCGGRPRRQSGPLKPDDLHVEVGARGDVGSTVRVVVRYRSVTDVPLVGPLVGDVDLQADATMRVEQ